MARYFIGRSGVTVPIKTTEQRDAIVAPAEGAVIYNTDTDKLNVRTATAWQEVGAAGGESPILSKTMSVDVPASVWTLTHNLNRFPSVTIVDSAGTEVIGDVAYTDANTVTATFGSAFSGVAYIN